MREHLEMYLDVLKTALIHFTAEYTRILAFLLLKLTPLLHQLLISSVFKHCWTDAYAG